MHSLLVVFFASLYLNDRISLATWRKYLCLSVAYFVFDLLAISLYTTTTKESIETLVHHTIVLLIITCYLDRYTKLITRGLLSEITNSFLYACWVLINIGQQHTVLFIVLYICLLLGFLVARIYNFTHICWKLYRRRGTLYELGFFAPIVLMNYYWFVLLLKKAISLL